MGAAFPASFSFLRVGPIPPNTPTSTPRMQYCFGSTISTSSSAIWSPPGVATEAPGTHGHHLQFLIILLQPPRASDCPYLTHPLGWVLLASRAVRELVPQPPCCCLLSRTTFNDNFVRWVLQEPCPNTQLEVQDSLGGANAFSQRPPETHLSYCSERTFIPENGRASQRALQCIYFRILAPPG